MNLSVIGFLSFGSFVGGGGGEAACSSNSQIPNVLNCPLILELRMKGLSRIVSFNKQLVGNEDVIYIYIWTLCLRRACGIGPLKLIIEITIL